MRKSFWNMLGENRIVIPKVQRDYVQGRSDRKATVVRNQLLRSLCDAFGKETPLELDFIYGYEDGDAFYPLDGQQRLTTLFLLHWYVAMKENAFDSAVAERLARFTYETRYSSRVFCQWLAEDFHPDFVPGKKVSEIIENQSKFFIAWKNDPTIISMLTMLDAIQQEINESSRENIWPSLVSDSPPIVFNLLRMSELGLQDELYIKMNSRGKPLTDFEYFKCRFAELLRDEDRKKEFNAKIDMEWYDLFWSLNVKRGDVAAKVDEAVLRYFRFIADLLVAVNSINIESDADELKKFKEVFSDEDSVTFLFESLDRLAERPLHVLINNAGIINTPLTRDERGYEIQFATNMLGHFELTAKLFPALKQADGARVVNLSSRGHRTGGVQFDDINFEKSDYTGMKAYAQSKTALILFTRRLDELGEKHKVRSFAVHPGPIPSSDIFAESMVGIESTQKVARKRMLAKFLRGFSITWLQNFVRNPVEFESSLKKEFSGVEAKYPGISLKKLDGSWEVEIPQKYRIGHEAHFGQVMQNFLRYVSEGKLPNWEVPNMIAKYYTTTQATAVAEDAKELSETKTGE